jgi:UDP-glucose 4-epimerase
MKPGCLLIGGSGFIGSHLTRKLVISGRSITVLDQKTISDQDKLPGVTYITGDFSDADLISQLVPEHDEIIHLAYATQPNTSFDAPLTDLSQNLPPTVQLFDIVARCGAKLLLVSSGGTVYGDADFTPISEDHPTFPISPYGVTKLTLEKYAFLYAVTKGLHVLCVRPSNPYGEGQLPFIGQGFISTAMAMGLRGEPITIFGEKGTIRDYLYVDDVVDGIITVLEKGTVNEVYNIGSGVGRSNLQVIDEMRPLLDTVGVNLHIRHIPERSFDVKVNILDSRKLQSLEWTPSMTFDDGLKRTLEWLLKYPRVKNEKEI